MQTEKVCALPPSLGGSLPEIVPVSSHLASAIAEIPGYGPHSDHRVCTLDFGFSCQHFSPWRTAVDHVMAAAPIILMVYVEGASNTMRFLQIVLPPV